MTSWFNTKDLLESSSNQILKDNFYFVCDEGSIEDIKVAFINEKILAKLDSKTLSYGLMGSANFNKIANTQTLIECIRNYSSISLTDIDFTSAINISIHKGYFDLADFLINTVSYFKDSPETKSVPTLLATYSNLGLKTIYYSYSQTFFQKIYEDYSKNTLLMFGNSIDELDFIFSYDLGIVKIKKLLQKSIEQSNKIPLIAIVNSKHLDTLLKDEEFLNYMNLTSIHSKNKQDFQFLIDNKILENKLNTNLIEKNKKSSKNKI